MAMDQIDKANRVLGEFLLESVIADRSAAAADTRGGESGGGAEAELEWEDGLPGGGFDEFSGSEHKAIGDTGSRRARTALVYGAMSTPMTFGDVVMLAGDMYGSYYDLAQRSTTPRGRAELAWARWEAMRTKASTTPAPPSDKPLRDAVRNRYWSLAAQNISHFSAGGTAAQTYMKWHADALANGLQAGRTGDERQWRIGVGKEAFSDHFLTDMFAAGHIRTPRIQIKAWYQQQMGDTMSMFVRYMAAFMYRHLQQRNRLPWPARVLAHYTRWVIAGRVRELGGEALQSFSLADIVTLALHNHDNRGLNVISKTDPNGRRVSGGYPWRAVGDDHLKSTGKPSVATQRMATAAVAASFRELERVRDAGRRVGTRKLSAPDQTQVIKQALGGVVFGALDYVPKENTARGNPALTRPGGRAPLDWRWGQLGDVLCKEVDSTVKGEIADQLAKRAKDVPNTATALKMTIHGTRDALDAFVQHLRRYGITALVNAVGKPARGPARPRPANAGTPPTQRPLPSRQRPRP
jgi:hypothetical protein